VHVQIGSCTKSEYYDLHRQWYDTVRERLITSGATWMEVNTEETWQPCSWAKVLERVMVFLQLDPRTLTYAKDCDVFKWKPDCQVRLRLSAAHAQSRCLATTQRL
jgi:hypothetical protein